MKYALISLGLAGALGMMVYVSGGTQSFMANMLSTRGSHEEIIDVNAIRNTGLGAIAPKKTTQKKVATVKKSAPARPIYKEKQEKITVSSSVLTSVLPTSIPIAVPPPVLIATTSQIVEASVAASVPTPSPANVGAVLISEVMTGRKGDADYDFVELYNTGDTSVVLTGWTIKKRTSSGTESGFVAATRLKDKSIPAHGYLLLANEGYTGAPVADIVWPGSYSLAAKNNSIALYKNGGAIADEAAWTEIPDGNTLVRDSWNANTFHTISTPTPGSANVQ